LTEGYRSPEIWAGNISASAILHSLPDAVFVTDLQARITYFNRAAEKITGFRAHEARGMYCKDVLKSGLCETECAVKRALDGDQNIFNIETTITTAMGETIPALVSASLIKDSAGKLVGYLYAFRDISPFKKVMSDLEISRAKLAERNAELDQAIEELKMTQGQLLQAQKMESLGTLAGGIAHDFNNILTGILGFASLIRTKLPADSPIERYVMQIERSAVRASELTNMILTFARRGRFEIKVVDLNAIIMEVLQILERTTDRHIKINPLLSPRPCYVDIDSAKMEQAIMNICVNAIEAMPNGGELTIKTAVSFYRFDSIVNIMPNQPPNGEYVRLSVMDTGLGMDNETRQRIFDPFFTTKGESGGTGLGLAMAYGVVNEFNGYIEVESKPGIGTTFNFYLPLSKGHPEVKERQDRDNPFEASEGKGETILLVDDESIIRELGRDVLEQLGYNVFVAEDGLAALNLYEKHWDKIDLVILDLIMPNMGGREAFECLRQMNPNVKVIISTGYAKDEVLEPLLGEKADGFIKKPYKIQNMAQVVKSVINADK
jgi:two-component system cell cycle sensor histidine kinase/response regulator CckA